VCVEIDDTIVPVMRTEMNCGTDDRPPAAAPRPVELLHPPHHGLRSGGHVYNEQLLEAASRRGIALSALEMAASEVTSRLCENTPRLRIWDSLFLEALASSDLGRAGEWGLLLHFLPSQDPTLGHAEGLRLAGIETRVIEAASLVIATGRALKTRIERMHPRTPVFLCEPGVYDAFLRPPRKQKRRRRDGLQLLTVANALPPKGLLELLCALARVVHIEWRWHVIGDFTRDAVYTARFDTVARQLGIDQHIIRHGTLDQQAIIALMDDMDLFVFRSRFEAYGMALAEAAARGLPAVTTDVGAASSLYRHGSTGLIAAVDDSDAFARHLERLMTDTTLRSRFRDNLRFCTPRTWQDTLQDFMAAVATLR
jgi:glycosyltransferase involved in cell wall biosynthesis